jgi:hypothetical protein
MTQRILTFEGYTDGQVIAAGVKAAGNSGTGDSPFTLNLASGTATARAVTDMIGDRCLELAATATTHAPYCYYPSQPGSVTRSYSYLLKIISKDTVVFTLLQPRGSSGVQCGFAVVGNSTSTFAIAAQQNGGVAAPTTGGVSATSPTLAVGTTYRVFQTVEQHPTNPSSSGNGVPANGRLRQRIVRHSDGVVLHDYDSGYTVHTGTSPVNDDRLGKTGSAAIVTMRIDHFRSEDALATFLPDPTLPPVTPVSIAAAANPTPVAVQSPTTLTATVSNGSGTKTLTVAKVSGPAGTLSATSGSPVTYTPTAVGSHVLRYTVVDETGSDSEDVTITATPVAGTLAFTGVELISGVTTVGGSAHAVLADTDDNTLLVFDDGGIADYTLPRMLPPTVDLVLPFREYRIAGTTGAFTFTLRDGNTVVATATASATIGTSATDRTYTFTLASLNGISAAKWDAGTLKVRQEADVA